MPGLTELTVVGETGQIRIQLEDHSDVTVSGHPAWRPPPRARASRPARSMTAIEAGHLRLLDGSASSPSISSPT